MKIKVTQDHIDRGYRCTCEFCPVALALEDATGVRWLVDEYKARDFVTGAKVIEIDLPIEAQMFIRAFDLYCEVPPFEFEFNYLPELVK